MSSLKRAWIAAAGVGVVEALKDQMGFCRWNYAIRSIHQYAKSNLGTLSQANKLSSPAAMAVMRAEDQARAKLSEESLRKVMYLSCWGPN